MTTDKTSISALVIMGVSGCGKSEVGQRIADHAHGRLIEGDSFHPPANINKMSAGIALDDDDRAGWLTQLGNELAAAVANGERPVLTCSALKRRYRERLREMVPQLGFVFLQLSPELARQRCSQRPGHFMPASLVDSQFAALEEPHDEPRTLTVDASQSLNAVGSQAAEWWQASRQG